MHTLTSVHLEQFCSHLTKESIMSIIQEYQETFERKFPGNTCQIKYNKAASMKNHTQMYDVLIGGTADNGGRPISTQEMKEAVILWNK